METLFKRLNNQPLLGAFSLVLVFSGLALGHTVVVLQHGFTGGLNLLDTLISAFLGSLGFVLVWIGMKRRDAGDPARLSRRQPDLDRRL